MAAPLNSRAKSEGSSGASAGASSLIECPSCKAKGLPLKEVYGVPVCDKCSQKMYSEKFRIRVQAIWERQKEVKRREIWGKRVDLVKRGMKLYVDKKYLESLKLFREYIGILEAHHKVHHGGLHPALFKANEAGDILLISGIYWDMAKIYDKLHGKQAELQACLQKYVEFSINRPHVKLSAGAMRKYLSKKEVVNREAFAAAHRVLQENMRKCFIATAVYGADSNEVFLLRRFRDTKLVRFRLGRGFIRMYYWVSPAVAPYIAAPTASQSPRWPMVKKALRIVLDLIVKTIKK